MQSRVGGIPNPLTPYPATPNPSRTALRPPSADDYLKSMDREQLKQRLKVMIVEGLKLEDTRPEDIDDAAPIFVEGLGLDSIDALELVVLIEDNFRVTIPDEEVGQRAFASIDALADFILSAS